MSEVEARLEACALKQEVRVERQARLFAHDDSCLVMPGL